MTSHALVKKHRIDLTLGRSRVEIVLGGDIDIIAAGDLDQLLDSLGRIHSEITVDLAAVTFVDCSGLRPLMEAARSRRQKRWPPLLIGGCSRPVLRLLHAIGIDADPVLDVDAWDRLLDASSELARRLLAESTG